MSNTESFYIEIQCCCPATGDTFTRVAKCIKDQESSRLGYWVDLIDDPNPKAKDGACLFFPPSDDDPQLWISEKLAEWLVMFLSQGDRDWYASHGPIEEDEAILRRIALEV